METVSVSVLIRNEIDMLPLVMPCYASLAQCLKEVVFVDDYSTDGSREKAYEIASHFAHLPIVWIQKDLVHWGEQRNAGLELCTGDFILSLDADMGFTGNMRWWLEQDKFEAADVWDFNLRICKGDIYTWDVQCGIGHTTRLVRKGVRYSFAAHEWPDTLDGHTVKKEVCPDVLLFEWSSLSSPESLLDRGRRVQKFRQALTERGIAPGDEERYIRFKYSNSETRRVDQETADMIPTMEAALRHWGKPCSP